MAIKGNGVGTPMPRTDWNQTDSTKADYLKGRGDLLRIIQDAQTAAGNAQTTAGNAQTTADNSQTTATSAQTAAMNAQTATNNHKNDKSNPHSVTAEQIGAAPAGLNEGTVQSVTSDAALNSALATAYNNAANHSVTFKMIHVNASGLSLCSGSWQFIINRTDVSYGTIYGTCYNDNGFVYRILQGGTWGEWQRYSPSYFAPGGYGLGTVYPYTIHSTEELDACRTCGFYCYVYAGTICGIYFDYANLIVYPIYGNECVQELRPVNTNYCLRRFYFNDAWSAWERVGLVTQILWVNASPTSNFAAQTIPMDLSKYDAVYVQSVRSTDDQTVSGATLAWVDIESNYLMGNTDQYAATRRKVTATLEGVTFSGFSSANTSDGASNEIPWIICGISGISR